MKPDRSTPGAPAVYIDCIACYAEGAGKAPGSGWVDAVDAEAAAVDVCPIPWHEEVHCYDQERFDGLLKGECDPWEATELGRIHEFLSEEDIPVRVIVAWMRDFMYGAPSKMADVEDRAWRVAFCGAYPSAQDFAQQMYEDGILFADKCDEVFTPYIDWERVVKDLIDPAYHEVVDKEVSPNVHYFFNAAS
jgi:antirestriction protein